MALEYIERENDIYNVPEGLWPELAQDIRTCIVNSVAKNGGHLSSSLGVVELTMALHLCLELPKDKILWDVGHQAYAHKILTGRADGFATLRQTDGMSGFPNVAESACDAFGMGHSSTSISAALGFVKARELSGENNTVVAVIGDGALTGGMAYEALNNCGQLKSNLIIILNDNEMSISQNVGGISQMLTNLRTADSYNDFKDNVKRNLSKSRYGNQIIGRIHNTKKSVKQLLMPSMLFEDMGITYLGPVDGHNIPKLMRMIKAAKKMNHAVLIHVHTKKGKGYALAEKRPSFYHGVAPFCTETGQLVQTGHKLNYSDVFSKTLIQMAKDDDRILAITAAMMDGTGLRHFAKKFPDRIVDVGIAEEHAITYAAGLAMEGYKPYVAVYSSFLQRGFDQIIHDVGIQNLPVRFVVERAGIVGNDGVTHQGVFDLSYFGMVPGMTIMAPKNANEFKEMLEFSKDFDGPIMIRVPKGDASRCYENCKEPITLGRSEMLVKGKQVALVAVGSMVELAAQIADQLDLFGIKASVVNARFVKPIDKEQISKLSKTHELIVTLEENVAMGGYGQAVLFYANEENLSTKIYPIALPDAFIPHGNSKELLARAGLDAQEITGKIMQRISK